MTEHTSHYDDELQELLDGRVGDELRTRVEAHVATCERCRQELETLRWIKQDVAKRAPKEDVPDELRDRIDEMLDLEDGGTRAAATSPTARWIWRAGAAAMVAAVAAAAWLFFFGDVEDIPTAVAEDYRLYRTGRMELELETSSTEEMEQFFEDQSISFDTRVFDLAMMNYAVRGGRVHEVAGRRSAFFVYQSPDGRRLICQMYPGHVSDLSGERELRTHNEIDFYIYRVNEITLVFWQEGEVTCVLVSDIDSEEVVQLAFAKAMQI